MRFIATADWHLGMMARNLREEARPRFRQARIDAVREIGRAAAHHQVDFVVACGDLFDSNQLDRGLVGRAFEALSTFTVPVYLIPGNHDPLDSLSIYDSAAFVSEVPPNVHVIRDSSPIAVSPNVELVGVPWHSKRPMKDLVEAACADLDPTGPEMVRIIAAHGSVSTLDPDGSNPATISVSNLSAVLSSGRANFVALGDRHGTYQVAPNIWYTGAPEVTHRREIDPGNALLVEVNAGAAVRVEKIGIGRWDFKTVTQTVNSTSDIEHLLQTLRALPHKENTAVWLSLEGTLSTGEYAYLEDEVQRLSELFAFLDYWQRHTELTIRSRDDDFEDLALTGYASEAVEELRATAAGGSERAESAQDALNLLYRFARSRS